MTTRVAILATSLDTGSKSQILARYAATALSARGVETNLIDLRERPLPLAGTADSWSDPAVARLIDAIDAATHLLFAVPIYNFDVNAAAKNVVEFLPARVLENKTVGFLCASGGPRSYMSVMGFANSLMLDFRCWIVPRFVYAVGSDFSGPDGGPNATITERIDGLLTDLLSR